MPDSLRTTLPRTPPNIPSPPIICCMTIFISTYLRPKIAADRSRVLNFYWMFVALITGVYTFGLAGILLGPILIGLLKAIVDTVTSGSTWKLIELDDDEARTHDMHA